MSGIITYPYEEEKGKIIGRKWEDKQNDDEGIMHRI
jgi:hypothetical protein